MATPLELRKQTGLSRREVAHDLGITERALFDIEHGIATPRRLTAIALAAYYEVPVDDIDLEAVA